MLGAVTAVFAVIAAHADQASPKPRPTVDELVRYFDTVVFGAEIDGNMASGVVAKWDVPIRLHLQGRVKQGHADSVRKHFSTLLGLTGLKVEPRGPGKEYNFDIIFVRGVAEMRSIRIEKVDQRLIETMASYGGCYFLAMRKPPSRIVKSVVVVNIDQNYDHCLLEEITQSLGLPNDSDMLRPSIFSDSDKLTQLSRTDRILVKTLYHPRMKAGLPRRQALAVARKVIEALDRSMP